MRSSLQCLVLGAHSARQLAATQLPKFISLNTLGHNWFTQWLLAWRHKAIIKSYAECHQWGSLALAWGFFSKTYSRYTTGKKYGIFFISATFLILLGVQGISVLEILSYEQILFLEELISTLQQNEAQRFKNNHFGIFLNQTMVRILFVLLSVCCDIHLCVVLRYCAQYHCLFTTYFGAVSRGLASWGPCI